MQEILSKKILGERIKLLRLEKAYVQADVADILNLSRSNYSQIELGRQYPTFNTLTAIAKHYNKSYDWLLHGTDGQEHLLTNTSFITIIKDFEISLQYFSSSLKKLENELHTIKTKIAQS